MATRGNRAELPIDNIGGIVIILFCLGIVIAGKDNATTNAVMFAMIGKMFGKYERKPQVSN